jgi:hypothetical protein
MPEKKAELYRMTDEELIEMAILWGHDREAVMELAGVDGKSALVDLVWVDLNKARLEAEVAPAGLTEADRAVRDEVVEMAKQPELFGGVAEPQSGVVREPKNEPRVGDISVDGLSRAVAYLAQQVQDMKHDRDGRLKTVEKKVAELEKDKRASETTHGSIDNLGSIDDLTVKGDLA